MTSKRQPGTNIPTKSRELVKERAQGRCERCPGQGSQWHHRRPRNVKDTHRHSPCNGLWLCQACHGEVHAHPEMARALGFIVSRYEHDPSTIPVFLFRGKTLLNCDGTYTTTEE